VFAVIVGVLYVLLADDNNVPAVAALFQSITPPITVVVATSDATHDPHIDAGVVELGKAGI